MPLQKPTLHANLIAKHPHTHTESIVGSTGRVFIDASTFQRFKWEVQVIREIAEQMTGATASLMALHTKYSQSIILEGDGTELSLIAIPQEVGE